jgi:glycosyltransferase involved in cell wall biosynthesis
MNKKTPHVAIFISFSGQGGVEKMICNLAGGLLDRGCRVDLVMAGARGDHLEAIPEGVKQIRCSKKHTFSALPDLIRYLKREAPDGLLAAKDRAVRVAVLAKWLSGYNGLLAGRIGTTVSEALSGKGFLRRWVWYRGMRSFYTRADHIVAVSEGVAADIRSITGMSSSEVPVIPNPVITPDLQAKSREAVTHPWLQEGKHPVVLGVGRMTEQKDFQTLIKAFALAREKTPCRLVILGEGKQRDILNKLICTLNIEDDVFLPGFVKNPYPWISGSSLFVLSSKWEG